MTTRSLKIDRLVDIWNNGNRTDVIAEMYALTNSRASMLMFCERLDQKQKIIFIGMVDRYEREIHFG